MEESFVLHLILESKLTPIIADPYYRNPII